MILLPEKNEDANFGTKKYRFEKKVELVIKVRLFRRDAVILHPCRNFFFTPITPKKRTDAIHGRHAEAN